MPVGTVRSFDGWGSFLSVGALIGIVLMLVQSLYPPSPEELLRSLSSEPFTQEIPGLRFDHANASEGRNDPGFVQLAFDATDTSTPEGRGVVLLSYDAFPTSTEAQAVVDGLRAAAQRSGMKHDPFPDAEALDVPVAHLGDDGFCITNIVDYCAVRVGKFVIYADSEYRLLGVGDEHRLGELTAAAVAHLRTFM